MRRPTSSNLSTAAGVLLVVVGVVVAATSPSASFGWFVYGSVGDVADEVDRLVVLTPQGLLGVCVAALGALVLAGTFGFRLGRRRLP